MLPLNIGPVVIKKDGEPLLYLTGDMSSCSREKILRYFCVPKEGTRAPTLKGCLVYSILDEQNRG